MKLKTNPIIIKNRHNKIHGDLIVYGQCGDDVFAAEADDSLNWHTYLISDLVADGYYVPRKRRK